MKKQTALGIMNGTSIDAVDFVQIEYNPKNPSQCQLVDFKSFKFPKSLQAQLRKASLNQLTTYDIGRLHHDLGRQYANCFSKLPKAMQKNSVVGLHGQTVFHEAPLATLQIGEASYLAAVAGCPVVSDFRPADLAVGGQGAPIATLFHQAVLARGFQDVSIHNLGGISNFSYIKKGNVVCSFDTGPANILMDLAIQKFSKGKTDFDKNGRLASQGNANFELVQKLIKDKYFLTSPPKSCGKEQFGDKFLQRVLLAMPKASKEDVLATLCEFSAITIAQAYHLWLDQLPNHIVLCGGGANNKHLVQRLQHYLPATVLIQSADIGWPSQSIEGAAFAMLAVFNLLGKPNNLPKTTGAALKVVMGKTTDLKLAR